MKNFIVRTNKICKKYKSKFVLEDVSINIKKGDIYGLIGRNGAGKTTLMRIISGLIEETTGDIELFGENGSKIKNRKRIGVLIETPAFFDDMDAYKNLEYLRIYKGIPGKKLIEEKLNLVGLENVEGKLIKDYSLGMKQKLGLAMALLGDPELLILDEPTNGLDPLIQKKLFDLLEKAKKEGTTVFLSSHNLVEVENLCDRVAVIKDGKIVDTVVIEKLAKKSALKVILKGNEINEEKIKEIGGQAIEKNCDEFVFYYNERVDKLIKLLSKYNLQKLLISEQTLEDKFMNYYESKEEK